MGTVLGRCPSNAFQLLSNDLLHPNDASRAHKLDPNKDDYVAIMKAVTHCDVELFRNLITQLQHDSKRVPIQTIVMQAFWYGLRTDAQFATAAPYLGITADDIKKLEEAKTEDAKSYKMDLDEYHCRLLDLTYGFEQAKEAKKVIDMSLAEPLTGNTLKEKNEKFIQAIQKWWKLWPVNIQTVRARVVQEVKPTKEALHRWQNYSVS